MRNKAALLLMEQLMMILVFALAAALCLQLFASSALLSRQTRQQNEAAILAQNTAEQLKAGLQLTDYQQGPYTVLIRQGETPIPGLGQASITVSVDGEAIFQLTTAWQEVE